MPGIVSPYTAILISCFFLRCTESYYQLPTTKTTVDYYTSNYRWDSADDTCRKNGGRLLQTETSRRHSYFLAIAAKLASMTGNDVEIWIGMVIVNPGNSNHFAWTDGCLPVCHNQWSTYNREPNFVDDDFCVRFHSNGFGKKPWKTTLCSTDVPGFICEHISGDACDYDFRDETSVISNSYIDVEIKTGTACLCKKACDLQTKSDKECWGFAYNKITRSCDLLFTSNPYTLDKGSYQVYSHNSELYLKRCFELNLRNEKPKTKPTSKNPSSGCFRKAITVTCSEVSNQPSTVPPRSCAEQTTYIDSPSTIATVTTVGLTSQKITSPTVTTVGLTSQKITSPTVTTVGLTSQKITSPTVTTVGLTSQKITSPTVTTAGLTSQKITSPTVTTVGLTSQKITSPTLTTVGLTSQKITSPTLTTVGFTSQKITSPTLTTVNQGGTVVSTKTTIWTTDSSVSKKTTTAATDTSYWDTTVPTTSYLYTKYYDTTVSDTTVLDTTHADKTTLDTTALSTVAAVTLLRTTGRDRKPCRCHCRRQLKTRNISKALFTNQVLQTLIINTTNLSSSRRRKTSIYEAKPAAVALGSVWICVLLGIYAFILLSDVLFYDKIHGHKEETPSRGYGYGKRKVRPVTMPTK